jgi:hypothetical protein
MPVFNGLHKYQIVRGCGMRGGMALECTKMLRHANFCHRVVLFPHFFPVNRQGHRGPAFSCEFSWFVYDSFDLRDKTLLSRRMPC